ncbi:hypothetical protein B0H11DRAFT_1845545 [Mycena galericulata]|nr:hypothetical protein B0H11DRAFT_1845545 [Mycena galericulata]
MIVLLILVHLLSKNTVVAPPDHVPDSRTSNNSCDDINNCRRLFDIVWGCLATIFACTWVSVHPNVPPPDQNWLALLGRRLKMMLIAIIAPELMVGFAARQWFAARALSKEFDFSRTHGFFISMGGFISTSGFPVAAAIQLKEPPLGPELLESIRQVKAQDIMDKSKGDVLSKGLALAQGLWFTTQVLARVHQHLVVTQLEVATLAFAVVNIFIWLLWWGKPLDVQRPIIVVAPSYTPSCTPVRTTPASLSFYDRFGGALVGSYEEYDPTASTLHSVPSFWSSQENCNYTEFELSTLIMSTVGALFGAIHCAAWYSSFSAVEEMWMWRSCSSFVAAFPVSTLVMIVLIPNMGTMGTAKSVFAYTLLVSISAYIIARLFLIVLPLIALRALPPSAFADVNWSFYIPHL